MPRPVTPIDHPVRAAVRPPGSKSFTNRALVVAALASGGASRLIDPLEADDTVAMRGCLRDLGVLIDDVDDPWLVLGTGGELTAPTHALDARASGTTARFVTAIATLADGEVTIDGTARMRQRPLGHLLDALSSLGAVVGSNGGYPPVTVSRGSLHGGEVTIDGSASSQFVSALLMLAPMLVGETLIRLEGGSVVSRPYLTSTLEVMRAFGARVEDHGDSFSIASTGYRKTHYDIEADASAAAYPLIAAAITGGVVTIEGIPSTSTQADLALLDVLEQMGASSRREEHRITLNGPASGLDPVDVDMNLAPDAVLALSVACLFARGPAGFATSATSASRRPTGWPPWRRRSVGWEQAPRFEGDDLVITPGPMRPAAIETYDDHRMAMSFAVAGLVVPGVEIIDPGCVAKTWPTFFDMLGQL